jgi:Cu(I)/Ag(I) efflux system membrane fusion protein
MVKTSIRQALVAATVVAALLAGYLLGQSRQAGIHPATTGAAGEAGHSTAAAAPSAPGERAVLYYRNPMGLPDTSPTPKKDPMGMDYLPVYADEQNDAAGAVRVSPQRLQALGVRTAQVERRVIDAAVQAVGRIELDERGTHEVAPRFEGWIERLHVSATGDPVRKGQPLFTVYSPELAATREELAIAERLLARAAKSDATATASAQRTVDAARARLNNWQAVGAPDGSRVVVRSPVDGIVLEKAAVEGMRFTPGMAVYRIANLSTVWVLADIYEQDLARLTRGQKARVSVDAFPGRHFDARITYVYPVLNAATRTNTVRLELANTDRLLQPGMFAQVEIFTAGDTPRLTVPASALIDDGQRRTVLVALGEGRFKPQVVETGRRGREHVEILSGLDGGEQVVVSANFLIDAESNLQSALAGFHGVETPQKANRHATQGTFDAYFQDSNTVMLSHEAIASLSWPAMSMEFGLANPGLIAGLAPGTPIRFSFEERGPGEYVVIELKATPPPATGNRARSSSSSSSSSGR